MKLIILAAGEGKRLRPLTNSVPKCLVEYNGRPIIDYILKTARDCGIKDVAVINGYKKEKLVEHLKDQDVTFYTNEEFDNTNMVSTLFKAKEFMDSDVIVSYADIIYDNKILESLILSNDKVNVIVDSKWKELWSLRMEDPLEDAETLKIDKGKIIELGKKPNSYDDIEGQYIGLLKVSKFMVREFVQFYESLDVKTTYDGNDFDNMYMTSLIQMVINEFNNVYPVFVNGGWIEIDTVQDLSAYEKNGIRFD